MVRTVKGRRLANGLCAPSSCANHLAASQLMAPWSGRPEQQKAPEMRAHKTLCPSLLCQPSARAAGHDAHESTNCHHSQWKCSLGCTVLGVTDRAVVQYRRCTPQQPQQIEATPGLNSPVADRSEIQYRSTCTPQDRCNKIDPLCRTALCKPIACRTRGSRHRETAPRLLMVPTNCLLRHLGIAVQRYLLTTPTCENGSNCKGAGTCERTLRPKWLCQPPACVASDGPKISPVARLA
jgi:hypothetical protein